MWFDDDCKNTCSNCKYGNRDISCRYCDNCFLTYSFTGEKYSNWEKEERGKLYDLFIQWNARFGKIFTHCKRYLSYIKKGTSRYC